MQVRICFINSYLYEDLTHYYASLELDVDVSWLDDSWQINYHLFEFRCHDKRNRVIVAVDIYLIRHAENRGTWTDFWEFEKLNRNRPGSPIYKEGGSLR